MADVYGVLPSDVASELLGLFPVGFTQAGKPSLALVTTWISDADAYIDTVVRQVTAVNADLSEPASRLARRWIISDVTNRIREAATNLSAADLVALRQTSPATALLAQINGLATSEIAADMAALAEAQLAGPRLAIAPSGLPTRSLLIDDDDLDAGPLFTPGDPGAEQSAARRGRF